MDINSVIISPRNLISLLKTPMGKTPIGDGLNFETVAFITINFAINFGADTSGDEPGGCCHGAHASRREAPGGRPEELQERFGRDRADGSRRRHHVAVERFVDDDKQSDARDGVAAGYVRLGERDDFGERVDERRVRDSRDVELRGGVEAGETAPYKGAVDCALKTVRAVGIMALYKGFLSTVSRQAPFTMFMPVISTNHRQCLPLLLLLLKNLFPPQPLTISALVRLLRWLLAGSSAFGIEGT
ncbi:hypothetical protein HID58_062532 [Brassica napus]|uniref:ADP,ATP carrier protein n=1 Tax=Brassica napus TaxID=3708 RepID=A0ABQ8A1Q8_BRANA|nr:hypothetical protein HID58_062532 [Brassica napus]